MIIPFCHANRLSCGNTFVIQHFLVGGDDPAALVRQTAGDLKGPGQNVVLSLTLNGTAGRHSVLGRESPTGQRRLSHDLELDMGGKSGVHLRCEG